MKVFRNYHRSKLADPEFKQAYCRQCSICPVTVHIVSQINASSLPLKTIALESGVTEQAIVELQTAENCCPKSLEKLCDYFNIDPPKACIKVDGI